MLLFGILLVIIAVSAIITNHQVEKANKQERIASSIAHGASEISYLSNDYLMYRESQQRSRWQSKFASFFSVVASLNVDKPEQQALVRNIQANAQRLKEVFDSVVSATGNPAQNRSTALDPAFLQVSWSRIAVQTQGLVSDASRLSQLLHQQIDQLRNTRTMLMYVMVGLFGASLLASYVLTYRRILKSIVTLQAGAAVIGSGNLDFTIEEKRNDEIGDLSHAFNQMTSNLKAVTASKADLEREVVERRRAEEGLRKSESLYRSLFSNMTNGFAYHRVLLNDHGKAIDYLFLEINDAFEKLTGLKKKNVIGRKATEVLPGIEHDPADWIGIYGRIARGGEPVSFENYSEALRKWCSISAYSPEKGYFAAVFEDITERKQMEAELAWLASFPRLDPNPVVEVDLAGHVHYCNPAAGRLFPELRKAGLNHPCLKDLEKISETLKTDSKKTYVRELRVGDPWYQQSFHFVVEGARLRIYGFDITERKRAEHEQKRSRVEAEKERRRLEAVMEALPVGVAITDAQGGSIRSNKAFEQAWGSPRPAAASVSDYAAYKAWWPETGIPVAPEEWASAQATQKGQAVVGQLLEIQRFDGSRASVINSSAPIFDDDGKIAGCAVAIQDITDLRKAEVALRQSEERLRRTIETSQIGIGFGDSTGRIFEANESFLRITGFSRTEILDGGIGWERLTAPEYADIDRLVMEQISATGVAGPYEKEYISKGGSRIPILVSAARLSTERDEHVAFIVDLTERKRAEEALRQSEEHFRALAEALPQIVWTANPEGVVEWFNQRWYDYTGEQEGVGEGWSWEKSAHPDDMANTLTNWAVALRTGTLFRNEIRVRGHDGQYRWFLVRAWPLRDRDGNVVRWFGTNTDVHDIKQIEETLRRSRDELEIRVQERTAELMSVVEELEDEISERKRAEEQLKAASLYVRSLIEASLDPLVTISRDGKVMDVNSTTELITGVARDQLIGSDFSDYFTEPEKAREGYQQVFSTGSVRDYPLAIRHVSGRATEVLYNASLYRNERGEIQGVFAAARDVTELKSAEQERLRLVTAIEQAVEGIVIAHPDGRAYFANQAFERINGVSRKEVFGKNYYDILPSEGEEGGLFQRRVEEVFSDSGVWRSRVSRRKKDGELYDVDVTISPVREASGTVMSYVIIEHDVTQELRLQEHVRQWQKMEAIGTLAGGIAHDFNNILMPITINTELAFYDIPEGSPVRQYLQLVLDAASRGKELVKQITSFSRQKEQELRPAKISPVVKEGLKFLRSSLPKNIEIREIIEIESDVALADPTQIHQILINLCNNGAYAMREKGGVLSISLTALEVDPKMSAEKPDLRPGPYLRLSVNDTGCGMERHVLEKVFDPFFTTKKKGEGTGMGLPVVAGIVRAHHGAITVSSEPGKGSMFNVFLPRIEGDPESDLDFKDLIPEGTERILFVDDEEAQAKTGALMLQHLGYRVVTRTDSEEALKLFKQDPHAIDLVVTDQSMPRMTGAKLAAELMRIRPDIPVILCTGFSETIDADEAKALGIREFVMKPFTIREMAETIRKALKK